jgi:hypothetical protein
MRSSTTYDEIYASFPANPTAEPLIDVPLGVVTNYRHVSGVIYLTTPCILLHAS